MSGPRDDPTSVDGDTETTENTTPARGPSPEGNATRADETRDDDWALILHDVVSSVLAVLLVGAYLFAISGVWPPLVAIESGSMHPNMQQNDLVFVMDDDRFPGEGAIGDTGVVTARSGEDTGYRTFDGYGDVIVFEPDGNGDDTPIIHRAMFWVEEGEDWSDEADERFVQGPSVCSEMDHCPANESGFITKGDHNRHYDQAGGGAVTGPVEPEWVIGTAEYRIPGLGWIRLRSQ